MTPFSEPPSYIVLHHTEVPSRRRHGVERIRAWHVKKGWADIGYHHVVRRSGLWEVGRPEAYQGAHCRAGGMNRIALGVCMEGHFDKEAVSAPQKAKVVALIALLCSRYSIHPDRVIGHREAGSAKSCPGRNVNMDDLRRRIGVAIPVAASPA